MAQLRRLFLFYICSLIWLFAFTTVECLKKNDEQGDELNAVDSDLSSSKEKQQPQNSLEDSEISEDAVDHILKPKLVRYSAGDEYTAERVDAKALSGVSLLSFSCYRDLTEKEKQAQDLFNRAMVLLAKRRSLPAEGKAVAYKLLAEAAELKHREAMKLMGFALLFGDQASWDIAEARKLFDELASFGSADAQLGLAFLYGTGIGVSESSQSKALLYYTFSALGGNPLAQMALGYRYWAGISVPQNCERALTWYKKVASRVADQIRSNGGAAIQRIRLPDENELIGFGATSTSGPILDSNLLNYYKYLADKGETSAQVALGILYMNGALGIEQNDELAAQYFISAAEAGSAIAYAHLGKMFLDGTSATPQDNETAFKHFSKAAQSDNPLGQSGLGVMYLHGKGVKQDYDKAHRFFKLAADHGWVDGQLNLGHMYYSKVTEGLGVKRNYKSAIRYFQLASQSGNVLAYYNLAQIHANGVGAPRNCHTAVELYKNVAERGRWSERLMEAYNSYRDGHTEEAAFKYLFLAELGYEPAQTNFAYILDRGEFGRFPKEETWKRALLYWQRSANQDYANARIRLGDYHYYGWGTPVDYEMAAAQYRIASERHQAPQALFNLGYMHEKGFGINRDIHLAKRYYDMAAEKSKDAYIPVCLALIKLGFLFLLEYLGQTSLTVTLTYLLGTNWDLYVMGILVGTGETLWKTITSVSRSGEKKGRRATRQPIRPLYNFYRIGSGPLKAKFPGLNAPVETPIPAQLINQSDEERERSQNRVKLALENEKVKRRKHDREKLHPLERGFSGTMVAGQKLGPPPPIGDTTFDDFESICLEMKRTCVMTGSLGRTFSVSALIAIGNGEGLVGYAVGKAPLFRTVNAIVSGMRMASRKLFFIERFEDRTIYQDFYAECRNTRIFAQRRPAGYGLMCHPRLQKICELIGIKDIYVKVEGSTKNYLALTHAFMTGLLNQETHQELADRKGLHVVELSPSRHYMPKIIASPIITELRTNDDLSAKDRLKLDDFYGEGRYPLYKPPPTPFYANLQGHLEAEWRKHPYRNQEQKMIRMMADGEIGRWTRENRKQWGDSKNNAVKNGIIPMPIGIGLTDVVPKSC
uniref:Small ribosomal subunit protein uS5m n=1 Tax=Syphacia muris TaxID=451379 RepID=A0A158R5Z5_9BILA